MNKELCCATAVLEAVITCFGVLARTVLVADVKEDNMLLGKPWSAHLAGLRLCTMRTVSLCLGRSSIF